MNVQIGYVVLYVNDTSLASQFWNKAFEFEVTQRMPIGNQEVLMIIAPGGQTSFQLVPLEIMKENADNLTLGTPSICLYTDDLQKEHLRLSQLGIKTTEIMMHGETETFAVFDNEENAFAIIQR